MIRLKFDKVDRTLVTEYIFCNKDFYQAKILLDSFDISCIIIDSTGNTMYQKTGFSNVLKAKQYAKSILIELGANFERERRKYKI